MNPILFLKRPAKTTKQHMTKRQREEEPEFYDIEIDKNRNPVVFLVNNKVLQRDMDVEILWPNSHKSIHKIFITEVQRHAYYREDDYPYIVKTPYIVINRKGTKVDMLLEPTKEVEIRWNGKVKNIKMRIIPKQRTDDDD